MRFMYWAAAAAASLKGVQAACPNQCSGHGSCIQNDKCECFANWLGADCSLRRCESGASWAVDNNSPHTYEECSGQGACNRATGECECFDGFTGKACSRTVCPADCSGHGVCKRLSDLDTAVPYSVNNWDAKRIQACVCDAGFFGSDCSQRRCPTGDDPLTFCDSLDNGQFQEVLFTLGSEVKDDFSVNANLVSSFSSDEMIVMNKDGKFKLSYMDPQGGIFTGAAVEAGIDKAVAAKDFKAADSMELSLETLPATKLRNVDVTSALRTLTTDSSGSSSGSQLGGVSNNVYQRKYLVKFQGDDINSNAVGLQNELICESAYSCTEAGCQPMVQMPYLARLARIEGSDLTDTNFKLVTVAPSGTEKQVQFHPSAGGLIMVDPSSQPQMPTGVAVDNGVSGADLRRYDMRVLVAVSDVDNGQDDTQDVYYTRVVAGNDAIYSSNEKVGASSDLGVWKVGNNFQPTLDGFTFQGPIPASTTKVSIPGAPGLFVTFSTKNFVADVKLTFFEILIKLPVCTVNPRISGRPAIKALDNGAAVELVDPNVENIECSARGMCDRAMGECKCFEGYYGVACHRQTVLV